MKGIFQITAKNGVELRAQREIPFVPAADSMLAVTQGGDFFSVEEVYWHCDRPDEITVYLIDKLGPQPMRYLIDQGWTSEP